MMWENSVILAQELVEMETAAMSSADPSAATHVERIIVDVPFTPHKLRHARPTNRTRMVPSSKRSDNGLDFDVPLGENSDNYDR